MIKLAGVTYRGEDRGRYEETDIESVRGREGMKIERGARQKMEQKNEREGGRGCEEGSSSTCKEMHPDNSIGRLADWQIGRVAGLIGGIEE